MTDPTRDEAISWIAAIVIVAGIAGIAGYAIWISGAVKALGGG